MIRTVNITVSDRSMGLFELTDAQQRGFKFNQISKLTIEIYSNLSHINIQYYLKLWMPIGQRLFFRRISQNIEYFQFFCNDRRNPFHFACRQWFLYNISQWFCRKFARIRIQKIVYLFVYLYEYYFVNFSKMVIDTGFKLSARTKLLTGYPIIYHILL